MVKADSSSAPPGVSSKATPRCPCISSASYESILFLQFILDKGQKVLYLSKFIHTEDSFEWNLNGHSLGWRTRTKSSCLWISELLDLNVTARIVLIRSQKKEKNYAPVLSTANWFWCRNANASVVGDKGEAPSSAIGKPREDQEISSQNSKKSISGQRSPSSTPTAASAADGDRRSHSSTSLAGWLISDVTSISLGRVFAIIRVSNCFLAPNEIFGVLSFRTSGLWGVIGHLLALCNFVDQSHEY